MKHRVRDPKLNRNFHQRRALFKNLLRSLIIHQHLSTTLPKAKAVQGRFDRLMTHAKKGSLASRRRIDSVLNSRDLTHRLVDDLAPHTQRTSGFTRIIREKHSLGDHAVWVRLELVDPIPVAEPKTVPIKVKKAAKPAKVPAKTTAAPVPSVNPAAPKTAVFSPERIRKTP